MSIHITPPPRAGQPGPEAADEPARRASRFDQRGIALQTVIIMVVLLAIAGAIAAVLFSRASETTSQLEAQGVSAVVANKITSQALCTSTTGVVWTVGTGCEYRTGAACVAAGGGATAARPAVAPASGANCLDRDGNIMGTVV